MNTEHGYMFQGAMGGKGDVDAHYTLTQDWPWSKQEFWVPHLCFEDIGDEYPLCSFKRAVGNWTQLPDKLVGNMFIENTNWREMQIAYSSYQLHKVQYMILDSDELDEHTSSYDPTWYLYHSMMSLQQYLWQDCNDFDEIAPEDLDDHLNA